ncbi:ATP-binding cassette domain-containing protein [Streptobacillus moniliformis]|uniref:ABC transporter ATP-binding protein n=1 Tax=Streptobacillus moniliformis TaxID=34105 RepID=UPI0009BF3C0C|nr:ATP-binding cassette domain-containing protein [Streptobacillus moniliformis]
MKAQGHSIIKVENLTKEFTIYKRKGLFSREKKIIRVVSNLNFEINEGERLGFLGPNGSGKSTTIKMLTGILTPTSGNCYVNSLIPTKNRIENAKIIGVVFGQKSSLWWDLTLEDNLKLLKEIYDIDNKEFEERYKYLDDILNIDEIKYKQIRQLSLGQRMKADLAGALLHKPKILFLDEPTIGLDVVIKDKILKTLKKINEDENVTILLTTHDMRDVEYLCNNIIVINNGEIIYKNSLENLKKIYSKDKVCICNLINTINVSSLMNELTLDKTIKEYKLEKNNLRIIFENNIEREKELILKLFNKLEIENINFEEISIDKIVKRIYNDNHKTKNNLETL